MMKVFKCNKCGNIVELIEDGKGVLTCCGEAMEELVPNTVDAAAEKHVPYTAIEEDDVLYVKVGEVDHPMTDEHYIQFIEVYTKDKSKLCLKYLKPNEIAEFEITNFEEKIDALEYCNIHGLWRNNDD